ncbi:MAG: hypothetical protein AAF227_12225 [Pseudomonadota bacterium]
MFGLSIGEIAILFGAILIVVFALLRRREKTYYGQTLGDVPSPYDKPVKVAKSDDEDNVSEEPEKMSFGKRLSGIAFLSVWLLLWSGGCYAALSVRMTLSPGDEGYIFMTLWLLLAIPAWFIAAWTLFCLLRGDEVEFNMDDDD